jgi:aspartyl-tRNA(Asn)/glutamyl-tRNA(Gln) amidotransferase subunit A
MGGSSMNYHYGWVRNPWNTGHSAGGSSGGTGAALAAGLCYGGMGTDTAGSIRVPAAFCGLAGMKATYGRVSVRGVIPESWTLDHAGPLARSVEDAAIMLNIVAGYDHDDIFCVDVPLEDFTAGIDSPIRGLRIGVIRSFMDDERLTPDVAAAVRKAIETLGGLGAEIDEVELPDLDENRAALANILRAELTVYHAKWVDERPEGYAPEILARLKSSASLTMPGLVEALRTRQASIRKYDRLMERFDALVGPTVGVTAPAFDGLAERERDLASPNAPPYARYTNIFDLTGLPVLSAPCGYGDDGLPVGLSVVGKRWDERAVLRIGYAYQQVTDWHKQRPPVR